MYGNTRWTRNLVFVFLFFSHAALAEHVNPNNLQNGGPSSNYGGSIQPVNIPNNFNPYVYSSIFGGNSDEEAISKLKALSKLSADERAKKASELMKEKFKSIMENPQKNLPEYLSQNPKGQLKSLLDEYKEDVREGPYKNVFKDFAQAEESQIKEAINLWAKQLYSQSGSSPTSPEKAEQDLKKLAEYLPNHPNHAKILAQTLAWENKHSLPKLKYSGPDDIIDLTTYPPQKTTSKGDSGDLIFPEPAERPKSGWQGIMPWAWKKWGAPKADQLFK